MIIVDENLKSQQIIDAISAWYPGQVVSITTLRLHSVIKDEAVPTLLMKANRPAFVTINVTDFWKKAQPHHSYCIILVELPKERIREIPSLLRRLFQVPQFQNRTTRLDTVVRLMPSKIEYYEADRQIHSLSWA
jgi:hypothetical protein